MDSKVYLAPLEGLADGPMRKVLCRHGGYDLCFSEFIRVTDLKVSEKTLLRYVPEYEHDCMTEDGTPIRIQLLGDNPKVMAQSAVIANNLGARSIDINFGCPSRFVHHSGAMLLREPELLHEIVSEVRQALDPSCILSVKVRLGFLSTDEAPAIISAVAVDGVSEITVHCRTRKGLYREEELKWEALAGLHQYAKNVKLIANGNVNSLEDAIRCKTVTGCTDFMCGRGAFASPNLGYVIKNGEKPYSTAQILRTDMEVIEAFSNTGRTDKMIMDRAKQFLGYARVHRKELNPFFKIFCKCVIVGDGLNLLKDQITALEETSDDQLLVV